MSNFITSLILCLCVKMMVFASDSTVKVPTLTINVYNSSSINIPYSGSANGNPVTISIGTEACLTACPLSNGKIVVAYQQIGNAPKWIQEIDLGDNLIPKFIAMSSLGSRVLLACDTVQGVLCVMNFEVVANGKKNEGIANHRISKYQRSEQPRVYINNKQECIVVYKDLESSNVSSIVFSFNSNMPTQGNPLSDVAFSSEDIEASFINDGGIVTFLNASSEIQIVRVSFTKKKIGITTQAIPTQYISSSSAKCCIDIQQSSFIQFVNKSSQLLQGFSVFADNKLDSDLISISDSTITPGNSSFQLTIYFGIVTSIWQDSTGVSTRFIQILCGKEQCKGPNISPIASFSKGGTNPNVASFGFPVIATCLNGDSSLTIGMAYSFESVPGFESASVNWNVHSVTLPASTDTHVLALSFPTRGQIVCNIPSSSELFVVGVFPIYPTKSLVERQRHTQLKKMLGA